MRPERDPAAKCLRERNGGSRRRQGQVYLRLRPPPHPLPGSRGPCPDRRLLSTLAPRLAPAEAAAYLGRVEAAPGDWQVHFEAAGDALKELAAKQWDAAPVLKGAFGSPQWYAEGDALSAQIDAALNGLLDEATAG
ncbi:hypothetical protein GCM10022631_08500 [Deinococcus rubellus]